MVPTADRTRSVDRPPEPTLARSTLDSDGYVYLSGSAEAEPWAQIVARAAAEFDAAALPLANTQQLPLVPINSRRLQLKWKRSLAALPDAIQSCVQRLEEHVISLTGSHEWALQDCYALLTPSDEVDAVARAPQAWHLDALKRFPVAALLLRGRRSTEFALGPYSDFSSGVPEATFDEWTNSLKQFHVPTWAAESLEEWEHFRAHLRSAQLITGETAHGVSECDWATQLAAAPAPAGVAGDASVFWSNKVHRGPGTSPGEERLVLFCSWQPLRAATLSVKDRDNYEQSETDYSYYDSSLEPKLTVSERAARSIKRQLGGGRVDVLDERISMLCLTSGMRVPITRDVKLHSDSYLLDQGSAGDVGHADATAIDVGSVGGAKGGARAGVVRQRKKKRGAD